MKRREEKTQVKKSNRRRLWELVLFAFWRLFWENETEAVTFTHTHTHRNAHMRCSHRLRRVTSRLNAIGQSSGSERSGLRRCRQRTHTSPLSNKCTERKVHLHSPDVCVRSISVVEWIVLSFGLTSLSLFGKTQGENIHHLKCFLSHNMDGCVWLGWKLLSVTHRLIPLDDRNAYFLYKAYTLMHNHQHTHTHTHTSPAPKQTQ